MDFCSNWRHLIEWWMCSMDRWKLCFDNRHSILGAAWCWHVHSNTLLLFPLLCRSLQHDYRRHERWGKLPTAACVPQVSSSVHSPTHTFLTVSYWSIQHTRRTLDTGHRWEAASGRSKWLDWIWGHRHAKQDAGLQACRCSFKQVSATGCFDITKGGHWHVGGAFYLKGSYVALPLG